MKLRKQTHQSKRTLLEKHESEVEDWSSDTIPNDLPVDTAWDDIYPNNAPASSGPAPDDENNDFESRNSTGETLNSHLLDQLSLTTMSDRDRLIALSIIDTVNLEGYLSNSLEELLEGLYDENDEDPVELDEIQHVLKRVQNFDPAGVCARDLPECLLLQLKQLSDDTPWLPQAKLVINHYLNLLGNRDYAQIMRT